MRRIAGMRFGLGAILLLSMAQVQAPDPLARARQAYNDRQFDAAIAAAREAAQQPDLANAAAVVLARAHLEKHRIGGEAADFDGARTALAAVRPDALQPRDRIEFFVGLGLSLYLDACEGCFSAAAEFFDLALVTGAPGDAGDRETVFEWWATALDRQGQSGPPEEKTHVYRRMLERVEAERARSPNSATAAYWLAAAARGVGDFDRAWGAAIAGWVRAKYMGTRGEALRVDLDGFVTRILLPERANKLMPDADPRPMLELLREEWNEIKKRWPDP